jgi:XTP/dITP diphosphohydrolase
MRKFTEKTLVLATHNQGKIAEFSGLLAPYIATFESAASLALDEPEETGATFVENAILKARAAALTTGLPALSDDSGLSVTALNGEPGIYSARWAGADKDFDKAMALVHEKLGDTHDRSAAFVAVLAVVWPDGYAETFEGRCEGDLIWPPRGDHGFGYDPMFAPDGCAQSFAEMDKAQKQAISHRAIAFQKMANALFQ